MGAGSVAAGGLTNYACGGDGIGDDVTTLLYKRTYACPTNALNAGMFKYALSVVCENSVCGATHDDSHIH